MLHRLRLVLPALPLILAALACSLPGNPPPAPPPVTPTFTPSILIAPAVTPTPNSVSIQQAEAITPDTAGRLGELYRVTNNSSFNGAEWSPDGSLIATLEFNQVVVLDASTLTVIEENIVPTAWVIGDVVFSPDGRYLAIVSAESGKEEVMFYDLQTHQRTDLLPGETQGITAFAFSPDGTRAATGTLGGTVTVWSLTDASVLGNYTFADAGIPDVYSVTKVMFDAGGGRVMAYGAGTLLAWQLGTDASAMQIDTAGNVIAAPIASPFLYPNDWGRLYWIARGDVIGVDPGTHQEIARFSHQDFITGYDFAPDGGVLATASYELLNGVNNPYVRIWNLQTSEPLVTFTADFVTAPGVLAFSPDGTRLLIGESGRLLGVWGIIQNQ